MNPNIPPATILTYGNQVTTIQVGGEQYGAEA